MGRHDLRRRRRDLAGHGTGRRSRRARVHRRLPRDWRVQARRPGGSARGLDRRVPARRELGAVPPGAPGRALPGLVRAPLARRRRHLARRRDRHGDADDPAGQHSRAARVRGARRRGRGASTGRAAHQCALPGGPPARRGAGDRRPGSGPHPDPAAGSRARRSRVAASRRSASLRRRVAASRFMHTQHQIRRQLP